MAEARGAGRGPEVVDVDSEPEVVAGDVAEDDDATSSPKLGV